MSSCDACPGLLALVPQESERWPPISEFNLFGLLAAALLFGLLLVTGRVPVTYNLRNLRVRWRTTLMTALAFTLVVGLMTVMLAFVNGMVRLTDTSGQPDNVMVLSDGAPDEVMSNLGFSDLGDIELQPGVARGADGRPLCSRETYLIVNQPIPARQGMPARRRFVQLRAIKDPRVSHEVHRLELYPGGQWFSDGGVASREENGQLKTYIEAVMGEGLAADMGGDRPGGEPLKVGETFDLGGEHWMVVGLLQSSGTTFDSEIWAKHSRTAPYFGKPSYTTLVLRAESEDGAKELSRYLRQDYKKAALASQTEPEYFARLGQTNRQLLVAVEFLAAVMSIGGVFGVMNTMFAAISQRVRDIGVLRLMGFSRWEVLVSFLLESLVIAQLGGLLGCAVGSLSDGWAAKSIVSSGQGGAKFVVLKLAIDAEILASGMLLSLVMGFIGGLVPALTAMRLRPLESLR